MHWPLGSPCPRFVSNRCPKDERGSGNQTGRRNFFAVPLPGSMAPWAGLGVAVRSAVLDQAVELHPDVSGLSGGIGERDRLVEGDARLPRVAELKEEGALHPEEMEVAGEPGRQRLDHGQR